jgi:hypothetical protein
MRKFASLLALAFIMALPALASAGTAYIPLFIIEPPAVPDQEYILTAFQVNNVSGTDQNVKITLIRDDGTPLANQPIMYKNGGVLQTTPEATDTKGEINVTLGALKTMQVVLKKVDGVPFVQGHGRITGSPVGEGAPGFLVANGIIRDSNYYNGDYIYLRAITINGGNPF